MTNSTLLGPGAFLRPAFSFVDLFAGIGGFRLAFEAIGGRCTFTSEWDKFAQQTYRANFDCRDHAIGGDITQIPADAIPPHDLLTAGFPCQPFSAVGLGTKRHYGLKHGFADETQGTSFFDVARIIDHHRPRAFLLENVKNLLHHDGGRTFDVMRRTLADELGYYVQWRVLNAKGLVPQSRGRVFILGFRDPCDFDLNAFEITYPERPPVLGDIMEPDEVTAAYSLSDRMDAYVRHRNTVHRERGNGFRTRYLGPDDTLPAIPARYTSTIEFFIEQAGRNPRRLSPRECARAQGFPDSFKIPVSKTQAYKQFGNTVAVPLVTQLAKAIQPCLVDQASNHLYTSKDDCPPLHVPMPIYAPHGGDCAWCGARV